MENRLETLRCEIDKLIEKEDWKKRGCIFLICMG